MGVAPKSYLPNYREFYERRWFAPGDDRELEWITVAGQDVRFGPDLIFRCLDVPGLDLHVEVCEDMWVPIPPSAEAALAGATVLANLSGSPITVARAEDRRLLVRSASARCSAAYVYAAAGQGESTTDLSWDGQTLIYECGDLLEEGERFPDGPRRTDRRRRPRPAAPGTAAPGVLRRQPTHAPRAHRPLPHRRLGAGGARRRHRAAPQGRPVPVRARRPRATRARLLRGLQHPGLRPRAAAGRDRLAQGRDRGQRWPRLDARADRRVQGDGPPRPPAQRRARLHDARLRDRVDHEGLRDPALRGARRDLRGARHPPGRRADARRHGSPLLRAARRSTTSPSRTSRPACATTTSSASPTSAAASSSAPATSPSSRSAGAPTGWATRCRTTPSTPACRRRWCST